MFYTLKFSLWNCQCPSIITIIMYDNYSNTDFVNPQINFNQGISHTGVNA